MYWIDTKKGVLRSVTAENVRKPVGTQNASSFAVDITGGKLYWRGEDRQADGTDPPSKYRRPVKHPSHKGTNESDT